MRFGKTAVEDAQARAARRVWHPWFAWKPVQLESGEFAWLETVERKRILVKVPPNDFMYCWQEWKYRAPRAVEEG